MSELNATAEVDEDKFEDGNTDLEIGNTVHQIATNSYEGSLENNSATQLAGLKNIDKESADVSAFAG